MDKLIVCLGVVAAILAVCDTFPRRSLTPVHFMVGQPRFRHVMNRRPSVRTRLTLPNNQNSKFRHHVSIKNVPGPTGNVNIIKQTVVVNNPAKPGATGKHPPGSTGHRNPNPTPGSGGKHGGPNPTAKSNGRGNNRSNHASLLPALKTLNKNLNGIINALSSHGQGHGLPGPHGNGGQPGAGLHGGSGQHGAGLHGGRGQHGAGLHGGSGQHGAGLHGGSGQLGAGLHGGSGAGGAGGVGHGRGGPSFLDTHHLGPLATGIPGVSGTVYSNNHGNINGGSGRGRGGSQVSGPVRVSLKGLAQNLLQSSLFSSPTQQSALKSLVILPNGPNTKTIRITQRRGYMFTKDKGGKGATSAGKGKNSNVTHTTPSGEDPPELGENGEA